MGNPTNSRPLRVVGSKLINELGQETRLQGVSIPSLEWGGGDSNILDKVKTAIDPEKWNSNFIRLPLNQDRWLNDENGYRALVESIVGIVSAAGKYIEIKAITSGNTDGNGSSSQGETMLRIAWEGRRWNGRGVSTDVVESSIKAYIAAINAMEWELGNMTGNMTGNIDGIH